ncbi:MAG: Rho termination factor N-terminal domain-containing protein [Gloeomargarita sp. SKYBB_i_bin120]|nr:Rho termination factor N-terminal domain-containing protein [Gloeomargarita sp. SKYG98]MCS7293463.1 Rho termination factor N-terminal domain-containing protein [Gloeomargarita sp. SKYB120]MDW8179029.1 Rho termination factor N-terminal domain-containing protein [Gloeomargarita sp. SKYBB_i_bin120]
MIDVSIIGSLMYLHLNEIEPGESPAVPSFLIDAAAELLHKAGDRNWLPIVVKITGKDRYQVVANSFTYAVAKAAGLERVWCVIADNKPETAFLSQVLAREKTPKINLCSANWDEIRAGLEYLLEQQRLKGVQLDVVLNRIADAPDRKFWTTFDPITKLKCGITASKLSALEDIFYLEPEPPAPPPEKVNLCTATADEIRERLQYLIQQSRLKGIELDLAVARIAEASDRKYWSKFNPITKLGCGITKTKLKLLEEVFYLTPEPPPLPAPAELQAMTLSQLRNLAEARGIANAGTKKKAELLQLLQQQSSIS